MIDVSELMGDPDFLDPGPITVLRRTAVVNNFGENVLSEAVTPIQAIVQTGAGDMLESLPDAAKLSEAIRVWTAFTLEAQPAGGYSDVVTWRGQRWIVMARKDWSNWGLGHTQALCILEPVNGN